MKELIVASKNKHKIEEIKDALSPFGYKVTSLLDLAMDINIIEDQDTFEGNALKKAMEVRKHTKKMVLADDSGLMVDALGGKPGVYSARFAGENSSDQENMDLLLEKLQNETDKKARFVTVMVLVGLQEEPIFAKGYLEGYIADKPHYENGFGYDPVFVVQETNKVLSKYSLQDKNHISHRANALKEIIRYIK